ncbi:MAG: LysM peptidoglycan-binding domain-containing M23 family metallopeptidase [Proteobacteria bacterium]|nr:LysM peptidoglycan-binding domain-containing M23 family metallopeptidase [Pseudomonadota bacterium]
MLLLLLALGACARVGPPAPVLLGAEGRGYGPALAGEDTVIVGRGVTLYGLAEQHGVPVREIIDANGLNPPYRLYTGQRLRLPSRAGTSHLVRAGDTLWELSRTYGAPMGEIARANGLDPPYTLYEGQRLTIPGRAGAPAAGFVPAPLPSVDVAARDAPPPPPLPVVKPAARLAPRPLLSAPKPAGPGEEAAGGEAGPAPSAAPAAPARDRDGFLWPVGGRVISTFGRKKGGRANDGINIAAPRGTSVRAAEKGVVAYAGNELRGFGNLVLLKHPGGWTTAYGHNDELMVKEGDRVAKGQVIARVGSTGNVSDPQLHFEMRQGTRAVDPLRYLPSRSLQVAAAP